MTKTRDRYGEKERPSTEEQQSRREAQRCQARAPELETPYSLGSGAQCVLKGGHEGKHKITFSFGAVTWEDEPERKWPDDFRNFGTNVRPKKQK